MAKKEIDIDGLLETVPELPDRFQEWCISHIGKIPIFYKRTGRTAECVCGKCGESFTVIGAPIRRQEAKCLCCGHKGVYEWKKVSRGKYEAETFYLIQRTTTNNVVIRIFHLWQEWQLYCQSKTELTEHRRIFLTMGDVVKIYKTRVYDKGVWTRQWSASGESAYTLYDGYIYPGWSYELKNSALKYCDVEEILKVGNISKVFCGHCGMDAMNALIAYANNPALEMYTKKKMTKLVGLLVQKEGKNKYINRRGTTLKKQLRLTDNDAIKRYIVSDGNVNFLKILQAEKKYGYKWNREQEQFLLEVLKEYYGEKWLKTFLKYMTVQQLMNRVKKYGETEGYGSKYYVLSAYYDYLVMREELGYDMTNEVYIYPKHLKEKHDEMVKEKRERQDKLHASKKMKQFPRIAENYEKIEKKYLYHADGYVIRPAKDAGEIIEEGRTLHHCVGGDTYLRRHDRGESYILFLRTEETPDIPYYTIEIRGCKILQWYGLKDNKPDKEIIGPWLDRYVEYLKNGNELKAAG